MSDWIAKHSEMTPGKVALIDEGGGSDGLTYQQLHLRVNQLGNAFLNWGVRPGDRVAILAHTHSCVVETQFAAWRIGAVFFPLNWRLTFEELSYLVDDGAPAVVLYDSKFREVAEQLARHFPDIRFVDMGFDNEAYEVALGSMPASLEISPNEPESPAQLLYSSGTTGRPKGVVLSHRAVLFGVLSALHGIEVKSYFSSVCTMPLFHVSGINVLVNQFMFIGGTLVMMPQFDPFRVLELINDPKHGITFIFGVPTMLDALLKNPDFEKTDFSRIERGVCGGAPVPPEMLNKWNKLGVPFTQAFGMTETSNGVTFLHPADATSHSSSIGKPGIFADISIRDSAGVELPKGESGEICVRGPMVTSEYWKKPEATKALFFDEWMRTGDIGLRDQEGFFYIKDRAKDMYISGGENVYPAEVEKVLYGMEGVQEVAVVGVADEKWGEVGCAVIVPIEGYDFNLNDVEEFCAGRLAKYKWPKYLKLRDELPHNATGKLQKHVLRAEIRL